MTLSRLLCVEAELTIKNLVFSEPNLVGLILSQLYPCHAGSFLSNQAKVLCRTHAISTYDFSDKLARWNVLGLQSALLALIIDPVYLDSIVVNQMFDLQALQRALYGRLSHLTSEYSKISLKRLMDLP